MPVAASEMKRLIRYLLLAANLLAVISLWVCCLSTYIHPQHHPRIAVLGLAFPICLLVVLCFIPVWLCVWRRMLAIPIAAVLSCLFFVLDYCPINLGNDDTSGAVKILSWNCHGYGSGADAEMQKQLSAEFLMQSGADIICVQEASQLPADVVDQMKQLGYEYRHDKSLDIFTKYPILFTDTVRFHSTSNSSRYYHLLMDGDTVLLINNHLESYRMTDDEKQEYKDMVRKPGRKRMETDGRKLASRLANSTRVRAPQVDSLLAMVQRFPGRGVIVCGDFNDTPISYTYQQLSHHLNNAFRQKGCGVGVSYNQKGFYVRIDHLFYSDMWQCCGAYVDASLETSDHNPLVTWLKREKK